MLKDNGNDDVMGAVIVQYHCWTKESPPGWTLGVSRQEVEYSLVGAYTDDHTICLLCRTITSLTVGV